jgi:hypothetical protein
MREVLSCKAPLEFNLKGMQKIDLLMVHPNMHAMGE